MSGLREEPALYEVTKCMRSRQHTQKDEGTRRRERERVCMCVREREKETYSRVAGETLVCVRVHEEDARGHIDIDNY